MIRLETNFDSEEPARLGREIGRSARLPEESAAGIIHDLGNLIQIASSAVNIISRSEGVGAELEPVLTGARVSLQQAGALVRQTIAVARDRTSGIESVDLTACLVEISALIEITWSDALQLDLDIGPDLPTLRCDPLALQSAVLNLLFNARDAMPKGGVVWVSVRTVTIDSGATVIELRVTDSGVGMTAETLHRAFEPFFTTKPDGLGGVGLPMVESFAREAGGRLLVESRFGVGTTATLQLPAHPSSAITRLNTQEQSL